MLEESRVVSTYVPTRHHVANTRAVPDALHALEAAVRERDD